MPYLIVVKNGRVSDFDEIWEPRRLDLAFWVQCVDRRCIETILLIVLGGGAGVEVAVTLMLLLA